MAKEISPIKKGTSDVAKLMVSIGSNVAGIFIPGAGLASTLMIFATDKYIKRPEKLLLEELRKGNIEVLNDVKAATFIPMAYKFFEAAKEGEYEHNLQILAEFLKNELNQDEPDPSGFSRMARRIEGLSRKELKVIALISSSNSTITRASNDAPDQMERPFASVNQLAHDPNNRDHLDRFFLQEALTELASRGLLIADGATRSGKSEEYYFSSTSFLELISKAKESVARAAEQTD
jgi:hypothetical protein